MLLYRLVGLNPSARFLFCTRIGTENSSVFSYCCMNRRYLVSCHFLSSSSFTFHKILINHCSHQIACRLKFVHIPHNFQSFVTKADNLESNNDQNLSKGEDSEIISIQNLCKNGNICDAVELLRGLTDKRAHINLNTYNALLSSSIESNDFDLFCEVFKFLLLSTLLPDLNSYTNLAKAFELVDSERVLTFIRDILEIIKDRETTIMNQIIFHVAKSGQIDKALLVFNELKKSNSNLDLVTFNTVLDILGKAGLADQMISEFEIMKNLGFKPDLITYNTIINSLRRLGKFEICKKFAKEILENGFEMDLITYTALIDSLGRAGHVKDALKMFDEMKRVQKPSIFVYRALISNLKKAGNFELALKLSQEMELNSSKLLGPKDFKVNRKDKGGSR
ncbi:hypothetical protein LUZ60_011053 [Juncus effusus]|nr:hypothetical protein LUZ60_011053 [Juncus effusus]